jgi:hypothetical protein
MNTDKHTCVCATCGQGFTRNSSAVRHNDNLHSGQALIVTPYEYIVGRLKGEFLPGDPSIHRSSLRNQTSSSNYFRHSQADNNNRTNFRINADMRPGVRPPNLFNSMGSQGRALHRSSVIRPDNKQPSFASNKDAERDSKLEELRTLLTINYSPQIADEIWSRIAYLAEFDSVHLDLALNFQRMKAKGKNSPHFKINQFFDAL